MASNTLIILISWLITAVLPGPSTVAQQVQCGQRHTSFNSNSSGIVGGREEDPTALSAPTQAFPWLVKAVVISPRLELLCVSQTFILIRTLINIMLLSLEELIQISERIILLKLIKIFFLGKNLIKIF